MNKTPRCCICLSKVEEKINPETGMVYWNQGENAMPFKDGRCCTNCQFIFVLPLRIKRLTEAMSKGNV